MAATTLREYLTQALPALMEIPGFTQLMDAEGERYDALAQAYPDAVFAIKIGRASCRERVCQYV